MKKLLMIIGLGSSLLADQFILTLDNIQSVKKMYCDNGYYKVIAEVDDNVEPIQLYKLENGKEIPAKCSQNKVKDKQESKEVKDIKIKKDNK